MNMNRRRRHRVPGVDERAARAALTPHTGNVIPLGATRNNRGLDREPRPPQGGVVRWLPPSSAPPAPTLDDWNDAA